MNAKKTEKGVINELNRLTPEEAKKIKQDFVSARDFFENQEVKDNKSTHDLGHSSIMDAAVEVAGAQDKAVAKKLMKYADLAGDGLDKYIKIIDIIGNTRCLDNKLTVETNIEVDVTETEMNNEYVRISDDDFTKFLNQCKKKYKLGE